MEVKGIGPAMIETLRPHLAFPATQPVAEISPCNPRTARRRPPIAPGGVVLL
jgi:hypothetical protein